MVRNGSRRLVVFDSRTAVCHHMIPQPPLAQLQCGYRTRGAAPLSELVCPHQNPPARQQRLHGLPVLQLLARGGREGRGRAGEPEDLRGGGKGSEREGEGEWEREREGGIKKEIEMKREEEMERSMRKGVKKRDRGGRREGSRERK